MSFPLTFYNYIVPKKRLSYDCWWNKPVDAYDYTQWGSDETPMRHGEYIIYFYKKIKDILEKHKYVIHDEKQFKSEIATFIYQLSTEKL
jgi:hypothetical protein